MILVGLTGGIASGKSTVSRCLQELGAPVVDADALVHELQAPGMPVLAAVVAHFGRQVLRPDGSLDRPALGRLIFQDPQHRRALEAIVHPAVRERIWAEVERLRQAGHVAAVLDIPLLFEGDMQRLVDETWVVYVDRESQRSRLMARDSLSAAEAERRIGSQMDLEEKRLRADRVIDNRGTVAQTREQVEQGWRQVLAKGDPRA